MDIALNLWQNAPMRLCIFMKVYDILRWVTLSKIQAGMNVLFYLLQMSPEQYHRKYLITTTMIYYIIINVTYCIFLEKNIVYTTAVHKTHYKRIVLRHNEIVSLLLYLKMNHLITIHLYKNKCIVNALWFQP